MNDPVPRKLRWFRISFWIAPSLVLLLMAGLFLWVQKQNAATDRLIREKIEALRAAGEPLLPEDMARQFPEPPPELDAGILLKDALAFAGSNRLSGNLPIIGSASLPPFSQPIPASMASALSNAWQQTSNLIHLVSNLPSGMRFTNGWGAFPSNSPASFAKLRMLAQTMAIRAFHAAEMGDADAATDHLVFLFQLGRAIPSEGSLLEHMIGVAILNLAGEITEQSLNRTSFNYAQLARLHAAVPVLSREGFRSAMRGEHCIAVWALSEGKAGRALEIFYGPGEIPPIWERLRERFTTRKREYSDKDFIAFLDTIQPTLHLLSLQPLAGVKEMGHLWSVMLNQMESQLGGAVLSARSRTLAAFYERMAQLDALRGALLIEQARLTNGGTLPADLRSLPSLPLDPISGEPLRLKWLKNGFLIYSVGIDGVDDGGLRKTNDSAQAGYDIVVEVRR